MTIPDRLADRLHRLADRRVLMVSGAVSLAIATVMFATSTRGSLAAVARQCDAPALDVRFTTSVDDVTGFLTACGSMGRAAYRDLQVLDLVYPAAFGLFLASLLALALPRVLPSRRKAVAALTAVPLLGAAFDYLENVGAWIVLIRYPDTATGAARLFGVASPAKQVCNWASVLLAVGAFVGVAVVHMRRRDPSVGVGTGTRSVGSSDARSAGV